MCGGMNILVLNGSPKGTTSNTYRLTSAFLEGIRQESPDVQVRERIVKQLDIKPCLGCFACWSKTPGKCCIHDDMAAIIEDMLWADVTVWSFPLYYFGIPGPLKNLMDRQLPMSLPFMTEDSESGGHPASGGPALYAHGSPPYFSPFTSGMNPSSIRRPTRPMAVPRM